MPTAEELGTGQDQASRKRDKAFSRTEEAARVLDRVCQGLPYDGVTVMTIKFKFAGDGMSESLAIVTGDDHEGRPVVAFHTAVSFGELFSGLVARLMNGTLKWKDDEFRN